MGRRSKHAELGNLKRNIFEISYGKEGKKCWPEICWDQVNVICKEILSPYKYLVEKRSIFHSKLKLQVAFDNVIILLDYISQDNTDIVCQKTENGGKFCPRTVKANRHVYLSRSKGLFIYYVTLFWPFLDLHPPLCHTVS